MRVQIRPSCSSVFRQMTLMVAVVLSTLLPVSQLNSQVPDVGPGVCAWCSGRGCSRCTYTPPDTVRGRMIPDDAISVTPRRTQAELNAERSLDWCRSAFADTESFRSSKDIAFLKSALEKLFQSAALLRNWSPHQAAYLEIVHGNIAWCYN